MSTKIETPQGGGTEDLFEVFCDVCYFHQWAVRPVGEKRWGHCYHLPSKEEAEGLAKELTLLARIKNVAAMQWDASDQMDAIDELLSSNAAGLPRGVSHVGSDSLLGGRGK